MNILRHKLFLAIFFSMVILLKTDYIQPIFAFNNPLEVPNNKFGIHIIDENDLENAAALVNSSKGSWGYVTMVIREDDRDLHKWQAIFDRMKAFKLIPIIRLATKLSGSMWVLPKDSETQKWSDFLATLAWPIKNRYVIIFNEPNHAKEWGGTVNPEEYGRLLIKYSQSLKQKNSDFFILPAGMDASAPNSAVTMDEVNFLKILLKEHPDVSSHIDGWTSHSYPNPGFRGKITDLGRGTLQTFDWELSLLKNLGINKILPVFITETGWPHQEGEQTVNSYYSADEVGNLIFQTSQTVWNDSRIAAITPFLMNYQSEPFSNFSWQIKNKTDFYPQFDAYRSIPKLAGRPVINDSLIANKDITPIINDKPISKPEVNSNLLSVLLHKLLFLF